MKRLILLIEDDPVSQDLIRSLLEAHGCEVHAVPDGFAGLKLMRERAYDVALVDYHLPEMDGYALARLMRDAPGGGAGRLHLVGITADRHGLSARRGSDALFDAILPKPIEPDALRGAVDVARHAPDTVGRAAEALLRDPQIGPARAAAEAFWRARGLDGRPKVTTCPDASEEQAAALGHCFDLVDDPSTADLILLLGASGLPGLHALRAAGTSFLLPAVDVSGYLGATCDTSFRVALPSTWSDTAALALAFAARASLLDPGWRIATAVERRLLAFLFVADRPLVLDETAPGHAPVGYAGGFSKRVVLAAATRLVQDGLLVRTVAGEVATFSLTEAAIASLAPATRSARPLPDGRPELAFPAPIVAEADPLSGRAGLGLGGNGHPIALRQLLVEKVPATECADTASDAPHRAAATPASGSQAPRPGQDRPDPEPNGAIDGATMTALSDMIGPERVRSQLERLARQLRGAFDGDETNPDDLARLGREAHAMISAAGMLGLSQLSRACSDMQRAMNGGGPVRVPLGTVRQARDQALSAIARLGKAA